MFNRITTAGLFFNKDDGAGDTPENDTEDKTKGAKPDTSSQKSDDEKEDAGKDEKKFTQAEIDQIIKDRLARESKKSEEKAEQARKQAEEDALAKNSEFQKLAEKRQGTITELEAKVKEFSSIQETADRYKGALESYLTEAKKGLPKHVLPLVDKLDVVEALAYITANASELGVKVLGVPETPKEREKKLTDEQKQRAAGTVSNLIQQNY